MATSLYNAILYNAALYGGGIVDPVEPTVPWSDLLDCLYPRLHATDATTLIWWSEPQLRDWANDALQLLARQALLFIRRDTGTTTVAGQRAYSLPQRHLATLHVTYADTPLQPTDLAELDSLDSGADAAACLTGELPTRWYEDTFGVHISIGIYPSPFDAETLELIFSQAPELLVSTASTMPIPLCMGAFIEDYVLGEAWDANSDFSMPELAQHFQEKRALYLGLYQAYWGPKQ
jgi:hypothetical protein